LSAAEHAADDGHAAPAIDYADDPAAALDNPRSPHGRAGMRNGERCARLFMRLSGIVLAVLVLGHLFVTVIWDDGVYRIDFNFVAQRWSSPVWRSADLLMLWLAELHGGNGMRTIIADYTRKKSTGLWLNGLLALSLAITLILGSYVVLTFDANIS
jgi:succinate dehydrogenase / fumarate reductase, membrane anchor subunit